MKKRAQVFNEIAQIYDEARPGYPRELIEDIIHMANLQDGSSILDIGIGTGQGTIPFADKGYFIHCLEPGEKLIAIAKQNMKSYQKVTFDTVTFEEWKLQKQCFDLVISAQAFHWVDRKIGFPKVAQALKENGYIALFWNFTISKNTPITESLKEVFQKYIPQDSGKKSSLDSLIKKREKWINDSLCFKNLIKKEYPWSVNHNSEEYINLLKTQTFYQKFNDEEKSNIPNIIEKVFNDYGGFITLHYLSALFFAQKG